MLADRPSDVGVAPAGNTAGPPVRPTIGALTGIRTLAALWVVFFHLRSTIPTLLPETRPVKFLLDSGFLGVDVFFVLSGFVISYNYADRLVGLDRREYRRFLLARLARIYPVHLFALLLMAAVLGWAALKTGTWDPTYSLAGLLANIFMLQSLPGVVPWNIPSWSVSCELVAYLVFPLVAAAVLRVGRRGAALAVLVVTVALACIALAVGWGPSAEVAMYWVRITAGFTAGCLLWRFWVLAVRSGPRWDVAVVVALSGGVATLALVGGPASLSAAPLIALFVLASASATGPVGSFLATRAMQWGGRISYSLYLVHMPVLYALIIAYPPQLFVRFPLVVRLGALAAYLGAMVVAAAVTYHLLEEPARRWLRDRVDRRAASASDPSS